MTTLYHIAIIEGFLGQHQQLPRNVQDAIEFLKLATAPKAEQAAPPAKKKKKYKLTPEQREKQIAQLARMRAAKGVVDLTPEQKEYIRDLKKQGKTLTEIAETTGLPQSRVNHVLYGRK